MELVYFDFAGRAEAIRDALHIGGVAFQDTRIAYPEFQTLRANGDLPFDSLPVLRLDDGVVLGQSNNILRWVGRRTGLTPDDPGDALRVEGLLDSAEDFGGRVSVSIRVDEPVRSSLRAELAERWLPHWCRLLERSLSEAGRGWLVGDALTIADLKVVHWVDKLTNGSLTGIPTTLLEPFPQLAAWRDNVHRARAGKLRP